MSSCGLKAGMETHGSSYLTSARTSLVTDMIARRAGTVEYWYIRILEAHLVTLTVQQRTISTHTHTHTHTHITHNCQ